LEEKQVLEDLQWRGLCRWRVFVIL